MVDQSTDGEHEPSVSITDCPTCLLSDEPSDLDEFGPHGAIADTIQGLIERESGGRTVAITGRYGSGKSTVIRLLAERWSNQEEIRVWVFDTWAHEGDPLRRTFLERLITDLMECGWLEEEKWQIKLDELAARVRESTTRTLPELSKTGWFFAASLLIAPVGLAILAGLADEFSVFPTGFGIHVDALFAAALALLPIEILAVSLLGQSFHIRKGKDKWARFREKGREILGALVITREATDYKTKIVETPEPTSIEFERTFKEVVAEALAIDSRRLLVVVDNLDRVEPQDALRIWSTLRTFLDHSTYSSTWLKRLWVVLPYDPSGIRRLWDQENGLSTSGENENAEQKSVSTFTESFLEKSIQIRFDVPPPLQPDWRKYLISCLERAFPKNHGAEDFHAVYRIVANTHPDRLRPPTPRAIHAIVNQIGALHRWWGDQIPLAELSYYVMLVRSGCNVPKELREGVIPDAGLERLLSVHAHRNLAAIAFGAPVNRAEFTLLETPLLEALAAGGVEEASDLLSRVENPAVLLAETFERGIQDWEAGEVEKILCAAHVFLTIVPDLPIPAYEKARIVSFLVEAIRIQDLLPLPNSQTEDGLFLLLTESGDAGLASGTYRSAVNHLIQNVAADSKGGWAIVMKRFSTLIGKYNRHGFQAAIEPVTIPGGAKGYFEALDAGFENLNDENLEVLDLLRPIGIPAEIIKDISDAVSEGEIDSTTAVGLSYLREFFGKSEEVWLPLTDSIVEALEPAQQPQSGAVALLLRCLLNLWPFSKGAIESLDSDGVLAHHLYTLYTEEDWRGAAAAVALLVLADPALREGTHQRNAANGYASLNKILTAPDPEFVTELTEVFEDQAEPEEFMQIFGTSRDVTPLVRSVLASRAEDSRWLASLGPKIFTGHWARLKVTVDADDLLPRLPHREKILEAIIDDGFQVELADLYHVMLKHWPSEQLVTFVGNGLRGLSREAWATSIQDWSEVVELAIFMDQSGRDVALQSPYRQALYDRIQPLFDDPDAEGTEEWMFLIDLLDENERIVIRDLLYERLLKVEGRVSASFYETFGTEMLHAQSIAASPARFLTGFIEPVFERGDLHAMGWFNKLLKARPTMVSDLPNAYRERIRNRVREFASGEGGSHGIIDEIARALKVRRSKR